MQVKAGIATKKRSRLYYGWVIVAVFALCHFTETAEIYPVIAVMLKPMTEEFGWSRFTFTFATSIGTFVGALPGLSWGRRWTSTARDGSCSGRSLS